MPNRRSLLFKFMRSHVMEMQQFESRFQLSPQVFSETLSLSFTGVDISFDIYCKKP